MDQQTILSIVLVLSFILVGGLFAGTELALVSLRETQLARMELDGGRGARVAAIARDPNRFLAAVQIGVTVAGFLSAAYGASTIAPELAPALESLGLSEGAADGVALAGLTLVIAYLSLVFGELVPKRLALQRATGIALLVGPPLDRFANLMRPVIWMLSKSTNAVVRLLGADPNATSEEMSEEELRTLVDTHQGLNEEERRIVVDVFDAGNRTLSEVMRPRRDVVMLQAATGVAEARRTAIEHQFSRYPVFGENFDEILGVVHVRDLLDVDPAATMADLVRPVLFLPSTNRILPTLSSMRAEGVHLAIVCDEYGGTDGLATIEDLVEELVGELNDTPGLVPVEPETDRVDAGLTIEEFGERTGVELEDGPYETAAGYVIDRLGRLGEVGDTVEVGDHRLVVADVDRNRITRITVQPIPPAELS